MITVSWDAVMDATSYMVERGYMDADNMMMWMTVAEMTTDTMYMDSGLMAETTYYYRVTAMNDAGYGDASDGMAMAMTGTGTEPGPMEAMAPTGGDFNVLLSSITVSWTPNSAQGTTLIKVALFNEGITDLADIAEPVKAFNLVAADPGAHTFSNVPSGMYRVVLAAVDSDGMHVTETLPGTVTVN